MGLVFSNQNNESLKATINLLPGFKKKISLSSVLQKTVEHPAVYGPPGAIAGFGMVCARELGDPARQGMFLMIVGNAALPLVGWLYDGQKVNLLKLATITVPPLIAYASGCVYALKKSYDSEKKEVESSL